MPTPIETDNNQMKARPLSLAVWLIMLLSLSACSPFSASLIPADSVQMPQQYALYDASGDSSAPDQWWQSFASEDLNRLIEQALADNLSLKQTWAKLEQAGALTRQSGSSRYPDLSLTSGSQNSQTHTNGSTSNSEEYSAGLSSSFELDLWGRVSATINVQSQTQLATAEDLKSSAITVAGEVSDRWLKLLGQAEQQRLLNEQLATATDYLRLVDLRYRKAQATAVDLLQQQESIAALKTQMPALQSAQQRYSHEIAVLLGNNPQQDLGLTQFSLPQLPPLPELGLPAELLARRPDIRAAGMRLKAADWQLSAAKADRLPALKLTAGVNSSSASFSDLFDNWILNLAANLTAPLLDGGKRDAEVDYRQAIIDEKLAAYQETVLTAIHEVEDAMISEQKLIEQLEAMEYQDDIARQALKAAEDRYKSGLSTYLPVLTELQSVETLQQNLTSQRLSILTNRVSLYRALGGSWPAQLVSPEKEVSL